MPRRVQPKDVPSKKIPIDWEFVGQKLQLWVTGTDIAAMLGISRDTLYQRYQEEHGGQLFSEFRAKKRAEARTDLRGVLWMHAAVNPGTAIFLAKNYLGMTDQPKERPMPEQKIQIEIVHPNTKDAEDPSDGQL